MYVDVLVVSKIMCNTGLLTAICLIFVNVLKCIGICVLCKVLCMPCFHKPFIQISFECSSVLSVLGNEMHVSPT